MSFYKIFYLNLFVYLFLFNFFTSFSKSEIPIIVISPNKNPESLGTIGSEITVITEKEIQNSNKNNLAEIIDEYSTGLNFSRSGGVGSNTILQIRGLPKRYTTVYIDGIKLSDPSSPDNSYYFNNLTKNSIKRVEILKGNQSSIYGSGAIGGTINIYTKEYEDIKPTLYYGTGSQQTKHFDYEGKKKLNKIKLSYGINYFQKNNKSSMIDNDEDDKYKNKNLFFKSKYNFDKKTKLRNTFKINQSNLNYDQAGSNLNLNSTRDYNILILNDLELSEKKFFNKINFGTNLIERTVTNSNATSSDKYYGQRSTINFLGKKNFNLDNRLIYGIESEFDKAKYKTWATNGMKEKDNNTISQFLDLKLRPSRNTFASLGVRNDRHNIAGNYQTGKISVAYIKDKNTKINLNSGTGIRFASLNDYFYDTNVKNIEKLKPEKSYSFDIGLEKTFDKYKSTKLVGSLFYTEYKDNISNWKMNTSSGSNYTIDNSAGKIKSKGLSLNLDTKILKNNFRIGYTYTSAYDGEDCDDPDGSCSNTMPVRIPRHSINSKISKKIRDFDFYINGKYQSKRRDYGNSNNSFSEVMLKPFKRIDLGSSYRIGHYNIYFDIINILDNKNEEAYQYSSDERQLQFWIKRYSF